MYDYREFIKILTNITGGIEEEMQKSVAVYLKTSILARPIGGNRRARRYTRNHVIQYLLSKKFTQKCWLDASDPKNRKFVKLTHENIRNLYRAAADPAAWFPKYIYADHIQDQLEEIQKQLKLISGASVKDVHEKAESLMVKYLKLSEEYITEHEIFAPDDKIPIAIQQRILNEFYYYLAELEIGEDTADLDIQYSNNDVAVGNVWKLTSSEFYIV